MKKSIYFLAIIFLPLMILAGCSATNEEALMEFNQLPLGDGKLITYTVIYSSGGSACTSHLVEALYYYEGSHEEVFAEVSANLIEDEWTVYNPPHLVLINRISLHWKKMMGFEMLNDVETTRHYGKPEVDYNALDLPLDRPLNNDNLDDGYFLVRFHYFPYPPNTCLGW